MSFWCNSAPFKKKNIFVAQKLSEIELFKNSVNMDMNKTGKQVFREMADQSVSGLHWCSDSNESEQLSRNESA